MIDGIQTYIEYLQFAESCGSFLADKGELGIAESQIEEDEYGIPVSFTPGGYCVDDVKGGTLPMAWVKEGRRAETAGFAARRVYEIRPRLEALQKGARDRCSVG